MATIRNRAELKAWLEDKPRAVVQAVGFRAGLRAAGMLRRAYDLKNARKDSLTLVSFCAFAVAWSAADGYNPGDARNRALDIADAAEAARLAYAAHAADTARAASAARNPAAAYVAAAARAAAFASTNPAAADAVTFAAHVAATAMWEQVEQDAGRIDNNMSVSGLLRAGLFHRDVEKGEDFEKIARDFGAFLHNRNENWTLWTDWLARRLEGGPPDPVRDRAFETAILRPTDQEWKNTDPLAMNARLTALYEAEVARLSVEMPDDESDAAEEKKRQTPAAYIYTVENDIAEAHPYRAEDQGPPDAATLEEIAAQIEKLLNDIQSGDYGNRPLVQSYAQLISRIAPYLDDFTPGALMMSGPQMARFGTILETEEAEQEIPAHLLFQMQGFGDAFA